LFGNRAIEQFQKRPFIIYKKKNDKASFRAQIVSRDSGTSFGYTQGRAPGAAAKYGKRTEIPTLRPAMAIFCFFPYT
jgi:hypothetical protein